MCIYLFFIFILIIFYIIFLYTNLPCFIKCPRAIVIDWALYKYFYYIIIIIVFQNLPSVLLDDDNFFDLLSRYQSRRIDDQRCSFRLTDGASEENKENTEPQIGYLYFLVEDQFCLSRLKIKLSWLLSNDRFLEICLGH